MKKALFVGVLGLLVVMPVFVFAQTAQADPNISMSDINARTDGNSLHINVTTTNRDEIGTGDMVFGIRVADASGNLDFEGISEGKHSLEARSEHDLELIFDIPTFLFGERDVFLAARTEYGSLVGMASIGVIDFGAESLSDVSLECDFHVSTQQAVCSIEGAGEDEQFSIGVHVFAGTAYGEKKFTKTYDVSGGTFTTSEGELSLFPGRYVATFDLTQNGVSDVVAHTETYFRLPGVWSAINRVSTSFGSESVLVSDVYFVGGGESSERGFQYWVVDNEGGVCSTGVLSLPVIEEGSFRIENAVDKTCSNPQFVGFLYEGYDSEGNPIIVDSTGDADFSSLITALQDTEEASFEESVSFSNKEKLFSPKMLLSLLGGLLLLGLLTLVYVFKSDIRRLFPIVLIAASIPLAAYALDVNHNTFSWNTVGTYLTTDNIDFTLGFIGEWMAGKPSDGIVLTRIVKSSNGALIRDWAKIVDENSGNIGSYNISLSPIATPDTYRVEFFSPGNKFGSEPFYGFNRIAGLFGFGIARFGVGDSTFSFDITVSDPKPDLRPNAPSPSSPAKGLVPSTLKVTIDNIGNLGSGNFDTNFQVSDRNDGTSILFNSNVSTSNLGAGSGRVITSGLWTPPAGGTYYVRINKTDHSNAVDESNESNNTTSWSAFTVDVSAPILTVDKTQVLSGKDVVLTWDTTGSVSSTCTLTGGNITSYTPAPPGLPTTGGSVTTTVTSETTYTLDCGIAGSDSVTVRVLPRMFET